MWQIAVAAAVAGSGIIAKHIFAPNPNPTSKTIQTEHKQEVSEEQDLQSPQISKSFSNTQFSSPHLPTNTFTQHGSNYSSISNQEKDGVFWFCSSGSGNSSETYSNGKKSRNFGKKIRGSDKSVGLFDNGSVNQRKNGGKNVLVRLKRRKTSRNLNDKSDSSLSKDCTSFSWGVGLGMMYMISAGKADINKLSNTIHETAKVVRELKFVLNKQKSVPCHQVLSSDDTVDPVKTVAEQENADSCPLRHDMKIVNHLADSDYASSVLTEEQQHEGVEMDQLEAELELELQKLPWCSTETSENVDKLNNFTQIERHGSVNQSSTSYQSDGVPPAQLKNKLSALLIEQQESQISELESELNLAYSKLQEKEDELRALRDCVRHFTEFSLSNVSDEETEVCKEEHCEKLNHQNVLVADKAVVGTKRTMHALNNRW